MNKADNLLRGGLTCHGKNLEVLKKEGFQVPTAELERN